ncbi:MAG: YkgJ family cysteine cluster protein [Ferruginibacter sp.]|nr:YkgJ family cysteine cluster protein [Ferruginibacter sp.]
MAPVNLRSFKKKLAIHRKSYRRFINKIEKTPPPTINKITAVIDKEVWQEIDCLTCANCCKKMTPTFTPKDLKRVAAHFNQTVDEFKTKWLKKERNGDWVNTTQPCQFLNLKDNKCSIYAVRPDDCAGFPHLKKKNFEDYAHVHKQNIDYCPATFKMVEKLICRVEALTIIS